jgi:hypothetical protein
MAVTPAEPRYFKSPFPENKMLQSILTAAANPALAGDLNLYRRAMTATWLVSVEVLHFFTYM